MTAKSRYQKRPRIKNRPGEQNIRKLHDPNLYGNSKPSWAVRRIDINCCWGWSNITEEELWGEIHTKLKDFESMTWTSIIAAGSHNIEINKLDSAAQKRLSEKSLDDLEELFSLRLTGKKRIWGILERGVLSILWYDPDHMVCPSEKKNS